MPVILQMKVIGDELWVQIPMKDWRGKGTDAVTLYTHDELERFKTQIKQSIRMDIEELLNKP